MKVILNQTVPKVGKQGQVVTVKDGFARNYLFPRGLAIFAEKKQVAAVERRHSLVAVKEAGTVSAAEDVKAMLHGKSVRIEAKVGAAGGKLFGAITSQDVADAIAKQLKVKVEKKQVALIEPIKRLGHHRVEVDLHRSVDAVITVVVFDPSVVEEVVVETAAPVPVVEEAVVVAAPAPGSAPVVEEVVAETVAESVDEASAEEVVEA